MGTHTLAVDLGILVVRLGNQYFKDPLLDTTLAPAHGVSVNHPKVAKAFGQIAPGNACAITIEHCLDKEAIILGSHSDGSHSAGEQMLNTLPLIITESIASVVIGLLFDWERKKFFSSKKNDVPQTIKCLFDDRPQLKNCSKILISDV